MGGAARDVVRHAHFVSLFLPVTIGAAVFLLRPPAARRSWPGALMGFAVPGLVGSAVGWALYLLVAIEVPAVLGGYNASKLGPAIRDAVGWGGALRAILIPLAISLLLAAWWATSDGRDQ